MKKKLIKKNIHRMMSGKLLAVGTAVLGLLNLEVYAQEVDKSRLLAPVNSEYQEEAPFLSPDGKALYFTRSKHPENAGGISDLGDIWVVNNLEDGSWSEPKRLSNSINDKHYNAVVGIDQAGSLYVLSFEPEGRKDKSFTSLYKVHASGQKWDQPELMRIRDFLNRTDHQSMSLSADGRILTMAIESYGSYGNEDLYVSFRQSDGSWSAPRNLGGNLNTEYQEMTPYLAADGKTLFFASNGHGGEGSRDLFVSQRLDDSWRNWSKPVNLGPAVNTNGVELFYVRPVFGDMDLYVSTQNSLGLGDIHIIPSPLEFKDIEPVAQDSLNLPEEKEITISGVAIPATEIAADEIVLEGSVRDEETNALIPAAQVTYEQISAEDSIRQESIAVQGQYEASLPESGAYIVTVSAKGYMSIKDSVFLADSLMGGKRSVDYHLKPLKVGTTIALESVHFQRGTANLLEGSYDELDRVVEIMNENPKMEIELSGHTDNRGLAKSNKQLSEKRVETVKAYMVEKGIKPKRIKGKGYGASKPIASNLNEEGRKKNRRVEFKVLRLN